MEPSVGPPAAWKPYPEVVAWLVAQKKGTRDAQFEKWSRANRPAMLALAAFHPQGVAALEICVSGMIQRIHMEAVRKQIAAAAAPAAAATAGSSSSHAKPEAAPAKPEAPQKRPSKRKLKTLQQSPDSVLTFQPRLFPLSGAEQTRLDTSWTGVVERVPLHVDLERVLERVDEEEAFWGAAVEGSIVAGALSDLPAKHRPPFSPTAAESLEGLLCKLRKLFGSNDPETKVAGFVVLGSGRYNVVVTCNVPPHPMLEGRVAVRFPRGAPGLLRTVATELANLLEAARGGFGPLVRGAYVLPVAPENKAHLIAAMERMGPDLRAATTQKHALNDVAALGHVASRLRDTVLQYSIRCFLYLDCSLTNFLLRCGEAVRDTDGPLQTCTDVLVTDLDPSFFRRCEDSAEACLVLNLLIVGAHLRRDAPTFFRQWSALPTGAATLRHFVGRRVSGLASRQWHGRQWVPRDAPSEDTLQDDLLGTLFYYFVSSPLQEADRRAHLKMSALDKDILRVMNVFARTDIAAPSWPKALQDVLLAVWDLPDVRPQTESGLDWDLVRRLVKNARP